MAAWLAPCQGYGYSDPFRGHTGQQRGHSCLSADDCSPSSCSDITPLSAWMLIHTTVPECVEVAHTWEIAARCFTRASQVVGMDMALYPAAMQYAVKWIWEMSLTTFLFSGAGHSPQMRNVGGRPEDTSQQQVCPAGHFWMLWV